MMRNGIRRFLLVLGALAACGTIAWGQTQTERNGFHLYDVNVSVGYSDGGDGFMPVRAGVQKSDYLGFLSLDIGYSKTSPRSSISLVYSPSYVRAQRSGVRSLSQGLSLNLSRQLSEHWRGYVSGEGYDTSLDQLLLVSPAMGGVLNANGTSQDVSGAIIGRDPQNLGLQSLVGVTPSDQISRGVAYGNQILSANLQTGASYSPNSRLSIRFSGRGLRSQSRANRSDGVVVREGLVPRSTAIEGAVGVSYALTPRTEIGWDASGVRVYSSFHDYYTPQTSVSIGRHLTQRWFGSVHVGGGKMIAVDRSFTSGKVALNGSASLGYTMRSQTLDVTYARSVGDVYGFGSRHTDSFLGGWSYRRPGSYWQLYLSGGCERLQRTTMMTSYQASGGLTRLLSRRTSLGLSYAYIGTTEVVTSSDPRLRGWSARLTLLWSPMLDLGAIVR